MTVAAPASTGGLRPAMPQFAFQLQEPLTWPYSKELLPAYEVSRIFPKVGGTHYHIPRLPINAHFHSSTFNRKKKNRITAYSVWAVLHENLLLLCLLKEDTSPITLLTSDCIAQPCHSPGALSCLQLSTLSFIFK